MPLVRNVMKMGGSLALIIPRDVASAMDLAPNSEVRLTLVGKQLVIDPTPEDEDSAFHALIRYYASERFSESERE